MTLDRLTALESALADLEAELVVLIGIVELIAEYLDLSGTDDEEPLEEWSRRLYEEIKRPMASHNVPPHGETNSTPSLAASLGKGGSHALFR